MTDVLADTSVWIQYLRHGGIEPLDAALADRRVLMCGPVAAELLSGARGETAVLLRTRFRGLRWLPLAEPDDWYAAAELRAASSARGRPVMLVDTLLAVVAIRGRLRLLTLDRDFEAIAAVADGLDLRMLST